MTWNHRWLASNVIWRNCIKMSHFIDCCYCCSLFDFRGRASLPPHGEASSGKLSGKLSASEMRDAIGFRQQLSTTSFKQFLAKSHELIGTFWLVHLTEHKVLHCYATNVVVYRCLVAGHCTRLVDSLQQTVDASNFLTIVRKFTQRSSCTTPLWQIQILKIRISSFCEIFMIFFILLQIFMSRQFPKVK